MKVNRVAETLQAKLPPPRGSRGLDEQGLALDHLDRVDQEPRRRLDLCARAILQHWTQRLGEQVPERLPPGGASGAP
jgi:hypothetical protein